MKSNYVENKEKFFFWLLLKINSINSIGFYIFILKKFRMKRLKALEIGFLNVKCIYLLVYVMEVGFFLVRK